MASTDAAALFRLGVEDVGGEAQHLVGESWVWAPSAQFLYRRAPRRRSEGWCRAGPCPSPAGRAEVHVRDGVNLTLLRSSLRLRLHQSKRTKRPCGCTVH